MDDVKQKAINQADKHLHEFMDDCKWPDLLEKYAELSNLFEKARRALVDRNDRGSHIDKADFADLYYYEHFRDRLAIIIANNNLVSEDYERDKKGNWILKNQPKTPPPKKKFGFWG